MKSAYLYVGAAVLIGALVGTHWLMTRPQFDESLTTAFQTAADVYAYTQEDVTETDISGRTLRIEGVYYNNARTGAYVSAATTTIMIPDDGEHTFSLENTSVGDDVYTRVVTESPLLRNQIAFDAAWHHFRRDAIPSEFQDIAVSGPILDHLALFTRNGSYLNLLEGPLTDASSTMPQYTFRLAPGAHRNAGGTLATLMDRIDDGRIRIWIDSEHRIRQIVIEDESFRSTTTLSGFNEPRIIGRPIVE